MKTPIIILLTALLSTSYSVKAQIYYYSTATSGEPASVSNHLTGSNLTRVNGATAPLSPCTIGFSSTNFTSTTTYSQFGAVLRAVEITLTPDPSYQLTITSFSAGIRRSGSGPAYLRYAYSINNGLTWIDQGFNQQPFNSSCGNSIISPWDMADFSSTSVVKVIIYGFNASSISGVLQLLEVRVFGSLTLIDGDGDGSGITEDCDDSNANIHPYAKELCNSIDDDCDGTADNNMPSLVNYKGHGGSGDDQAIGMQLYPDGSSILAGTSRSNDDDVTNPHGGSDFWVVKTNYKGDTVWQKSYGGSSDETMKDFQLTSDGGFILCGSSTSGDGDLTGNHGSEDYWIVKADNMGNIQWQKNLGGSASDIATSVQQTPGGDYIIGGESSSTEGDVTGNHGSSDAWVIRLDASGNVAWKKCFGGSDEESNVMVRFFYLAGFIVGCESFSEDGDAQGSHGTYQDFLLIRLDNNGTKVWFRMAGSNSDDYLRALVSTSDGGCIAGGTIHGMYGDVTGYHGQYDMWIIKLDGNGNIQWQHALGGSDYDYMRDVKSADASSYLVWGESRSRDGDVTNPNGDDYLPQFQTWLLKVDGSGNIIWDKSLGPELNLSAVSASKNIYVKTDGSCFVSYYNNVTFGPAITAFLINPDGSEKWSIDDGGPVKHKELPGFYFAFTTTLFVGGNESGTYQLGGTSYGSGYDDDDYFHNQIKLSPFTLYADADGDGFGNPNDSILSCNTYYGGYTTNILDCNDQNNTVFPGAVEICNGIDDNCNGIVDDNPSASVSPSGNVTICKGGALTLTANGGTGVTYQWLKNGANISGATLQTYSPTKTASYSVKESNSFGCTSTSAETDFSIFNPAASIIPLGNLDICATGVVDLQANPSDGATYQWLKGSNILAGATDYLYTATSKGTYKVTVTNINTGCGKTSSGVKVTKDCKLAEEAIWDFGIYPNPASSSFTITINNEITDAISVMEIHNELGQIIMTSLLEAGNANLNVYVEIPAIWSNGIYFVSVKTGQSKVVRPVVINR